METTTMTTDALADDRRRVQGMKTMKEAAVDRRQAPCIGNDNGVLIFLAFRLLTVTLSRLCLVAVSF